MLLSTLLTAAPRALTILFIGNSHTSYNDVPGMVRNLIVSAGQIEKVTTKGVFGGLLNDQAKSGNLKKEIASGKWNVIVLQGATVSSSHKFKYSQEGGIELTKLAKKSGAKTYLFAEWPRRGWDEAQLQMKVYEEIARAASAPIVPIPWVFWKAIQSDDDLEFWQADGNHASVLGSYLASVTLYFWITEQHTYDPKWAPKGMSYEMSRRMIGFARNQHILENPPLGSN